MLGMKYPKDWMMLPSWSIQKVVACKKFQESMRWVELDVRVVGIRGFRKKSSGTVRMKSAIAQTRRAVHGPYKASSDYMTNGRMTPAMLLPAHSVP